jgi:hypothetical protein
MVCHKPVGASTSKQIITVNGTGMAGCTGFDY